VKRTKAKYGICVEDVYNFNEASFIIDKITTQLVVTGLERRGRPKAVQPGNREWVTVIQGINAAGWAIPPFIIFASCQDRSTDKVTWARVYSLDRSLPLLGSD
jgi:hypothetical protein